MTTLDDTHPPSKVPIALDRKILKSRLQKRRRQSIKNINNWMPKRCCKRLCVFEVGTEKCRAMRENFLSISRDERKARLADLIVPDPQCSQRYFYCDGWQVCWRMVIDTLEVSRTMIANVMELPSANATHLPGRMGGSDGSLTKKSSVISFLRALADDLGDEMPHSIERHLPHGNKYLVYMLFRENEGMYGRQACSSSHFYETWKLYASHIKCRRRHGFSVCDTCTSFKEGLLSIARKTGYEKSREKLKKGFRAHLQQIHSERAEYRFIQSKAIDRPQEILSVIIDGADQAKFGLPRFYTTTKRDTGKALKQKVTGVCYHGALSGQHFVCFFTSADNIPSGANQTIDALCRSLFLLRDAKRAQGMSCFPKELNVQLDNTSKDNKNRFFFAFCDYMVHKGLFNRIVVNFLPVGHTHEDIDRRFSRISVFMRDRNTACVSELHRHIVESQGGNSASVQNNIHASRVSGMNNFSGACDKQSAVASKINNMLTFRKFVFERDDSHELEGGGAHVTCLVGYKMVEKREALEKLDRTEGFIGSFLRFVPDMTKAEAIKTNKPSQVDISAYRKRINVTENRIGCRENVLSLLSEIDAIESKGFALPEWEFRQFASFCDDCRDHENSHDDSESELALEDTCTYKRGSIVTVNCGSNVTEVTPFWLGRVEHVENANSDNVILTVRWFEFVQGQRGESLCYTGNYAPMKQNGQSQSDIPSAAVFVYFPELNTTGKIPDVVQRLTREAVDPFGEC